MDDATIRDRIRAVIDTGELRCDEPDKVWAGRGLGTHCVACAQPIAVGEIEYEVDLPSGRMIRLHRRCYDLWREECEALSPSS
jgi:hypothetical protein